MDLRAELAGYSDLPGSAKLKLLETQGGLLVFYIDLKLYFSILTRLELYETSDFRD